ncbi:hypothetical protein VTN31DRAFT_653 [Thermomyces dupontii]|uniref:uncharacterized protein n=1 Tax=Talaromyces thermophilus TaxID=28565 RepID=UPI003743E325
MSSSTSAISAYRQLLRATRIAFKDDYRTLFAARAEARKHFEQNRNAGVDAPMKINDALEAADMLRRNIVQGVRDAEDESGVWELRIHDEIERGDNDTVRIGKKNVKVDKPCSS